MKMKTWAALGTFAFSAWRGYSKMKRTVRRNAKTKLRRAARAI